MVIDMKALIAFAVMAVLVLTLIEINERIKAKRKPQDPKTPQNEDCEKNTDGDCSACELISVCDKKAES